MAQKKKPFKKIALALSLCLILLWTVLGTGASLAWFTDTDEEIKNIFHFAEFDLEVEYRDKNGDYHDLEGATEVFDDDALYEPGYVQVVVLRVTNKGTVPFTFKGAVTVTDYTEATNVFGQRFHLQDYLRFGLVNAPTEQALDAKIADRDLAAAAADMPLNYYSTDSATLDAGASTYIALVVRMPKEVDNFANYRGDTIPRVELGIIVTADQLKN